MSGILRAPGEEFNKSIKFYDKVIIILSAMGPVK